MLSAGWWQPFLAGVWTSVTQPYWFIWWASLGASAVYAASGKAGIAGVGAFYVGHVLADLIWFTFVAAGVGAGRRVLSEAAFRKLFVACGAIMLGFGLLFVAVGAFFPNEFEPKKKPPPAAASAASSAEPAPAPGTAAPPADATRP
jgi:threonine/homoserine/homoserine lactone efflux protein